MSARVKRDLPRSVIDAHIAVLPDPPAPMDFDELFGGPGPVEVEVGFGKGRFLITSAEAQPETRFIGVEVRDILKEYVANRLAKRSLANAKVMGADARLFMRHAVTDGALDAIHFYFPDPWWKKRHHRRRIWQSPLFADFERALRPGGALHIASDVAMVYDEMRALASAQPLLTEDPSIDRAPPCTTNFEDKASRDGRPVGRTAFVKAG